MIFLTWSTLDGALKSLFGSTLLFISLDVSSLKTQRLMAILYQKVTVFMICVIQNSCIMCTGAGVGINVYGIHHNLDVWDNPEVSYAS